MTSYQRMALAFTWLGALGSSFILIAIAVSVSLPYNPASFSVVSGFQSKNVRLLLPEGFSFFTRNPREPLTFVFRVNPDGTLTNVTRTNSSIEDWFGVKRNNRAFFAQLGNVLTQANINPDSFPLTDACGPDEIAIRNVQPYPLLCGKYLIKIQERAPWAWAASFPQQDMPSREIALNIACE